jgi:hypothetical protein
LGGVVLILASILIWYFVQRRRRRNVKQQPPLDDGTTGIKEKPKQKDPSELEVKPGELPGHPVHRRQPIEALREMEA